MLLLSQLLRLDVSVRLASIATITFLLLPNPSNAQTYSSCNPTKQTCPADTALGKSTSIDFTSGSSNQFTASGNPTYGTDGVSLAVAKSGDAPTLSSNWYIMFGKVEVVMKAAPGQGIVSSAVLQSDDLDEIDWEIVGSQVDQVQTSYFSKGDTSTVGRGGIHQATSVDTIFQTYTVDWTATEIVWQIDGVTQRVLKASDLDGAYPQTPMMLKLGVWSGGDSSNAAGTIEWAGGATDYSAGPFTMTVKSVSVQDYSTGTSYSYSDTSGEWTSITAAGGSVNQGSTKVDTDAPAVTSVVNGAPVGWDGTHRETSSAAARTGWPWVTTGTTLSTSTATDASLPGLPSGWTVGASGKVIPPSAAPTVDIPLRIALLASCSLAFGFALIL